jgi:hypothetical protein
VATILTVQGTLAAAFAPSDVESDTNQASNAIVNVLVGQGSIPEVSGFINAQVPVANISGLNLDAAVTITVTQP